MTNPFDHIELSIEAAQLLHYLSTERSRATIHPDRPVTGKKLAERFGTSEREIQEQIRELREAGELIGVGPGGKGYYFALDISEMAATLGSMKSRVAKIQHTIRRIESKLAEEQMTLRL